eukprot:TRINITY_DN1269_c0_g1_i2.p1 TRINITY_DN1269_c0_g1~~TRINITY_DN1269_c0_g1_i2.p1  ORF type:complete len:266 (+),score=40.58 TRINITY_DN1269_c0_g1_i2:114-911(+)
MADDMSKLLASFSSQMSTIKDTTQPSSRGTCGTCGQEILGELTHANGRVYHPEHLLCGMCKTPLGTTEYYEHEDKSFCKHCFETKICDQCSKCHTAIMDSMVDVNGRKYHGACFSCTHCNVSLDGVGFLERDGQPFCEAHYHAGFGTPCHACKKPIIGDGATAVGKNYHFQCLKCAKCNRVLEGGRFWEFGGQAYCEPDYHASKGMLCAGCAGPIAAGRVINALGKKWHPEHFTCSGCQTGLNGKSFAEVEGLAYCEPCDIRLHP